MMYFEYYNEFRKLGYSIIFLLFALCLLEVKSGIESIFFPDPNKSIIIWPDAILFG
jgi:hypothetical protein